MSVIIKRSVPISTLSTVHKTGQTTVYATGDDGTYQAGNSLTTRFIDNGNGTITDKLTNLMWVKHVQRIIPGTSIIASNQTQAARGSWAISTVYAIADIVIDSVGSTGCYVCAVAHTSGTTSFATDIGTNPTYWIFTAWAIAADSLTATGKQSTMAFTSAITNCEALVYAGYSDWRLPNIEELLSLVNFSATAVPYSFNTLLLTNAQYNSFYSSTTMGVTTTNAWGVYYSGSTIISNLIKTNAYYVQPVRGGLS